MDLRSLRHFLAVVQHDGFARAAGPAHASQPTLSRAVAQLEAEMGQRLLERDRHGVHLTQAGAIVWRHAQALQAQLSDMRAELDALQQLARGELRLGLPPLGSHVLFAGPLARYRQRYPGITIHLHEHGGRQLEQQVLSGQLDVGATLMPHAPALASQMIRDEPMLALLPAGHRRAAARRFRLAWLAEESLILFERGFALNQLIRQACARAGVAPRELVHSAQVDFILALVSAGSGIALLPRIALAERTLAGLVAIPLPRSTLHWQLAWVWRQGVELPMAARAWLTLQNETSVDSANEA